MTVAIVLGAARTIVWAYFVVPIAFSGQTEIGGVLIRLAVNVAGYIFLLICLTQLQRGKSWPRVAFSVFLVMGILNIVTSKKTFEPLNPFSMSVVVELFVVSIAIMLLFGKASNAWYGLRKLRLE